jgi:hypothetical protein
MPNLRSSLDALASSFANAVLDAIRGASLAELQAEGSEIGNGRRARAAAHQSHASTKGVGKGTGPSPSPSPQAKKAKKGRLARRSPADIARALDAVVILVRKSKGGMRSEEIRRALRLDVREVPRVLKEGLAKKKLKSKGQKRATTYSAA